MNLDSIRRIYCGTPSFLIDHWHLGEGVVTISGWCLSGYEPMSNYQFVVNKREPIKQSVGLKSPSLAKVFPYFAGASESAFEIKVKVSNEDIEEGTLAVSLVDALFKEPINEFHTTYIPLNTGGIVVPDAAQLQRTQGNTSTARYLAYGLTTALRIEKLIWRYFQKDISELSSILDWGGGCGRVYQHIYARNSAAIACDIDEQNILWCRDNLPGAFFQNGLLPPLSDLPDSSLALIYGISVFTHLDAASASRWKEELHRVLQSDGVLIVTVHGLTGISRILADDRLKSVARAGFDASQSDSRLAGYIADADYYRATYQSPSDVRAFFATHFEVIDILRGANALLQDFVILKKL